MKSRSIAGAVTAELEVAVEDRGCAAGTAAGAACARNAGDATGADGPANAEGAADTAACAPDVAESIGAKAGGNPPDADAAPVAPSAPAATPSPPDTTEFFIKTAPGNADIPGGGEATTSGSSISSNGKSGKCSENGDDGTPAPDIGLTVFGLAVAGLAVLALAVAIGPAPAIGLAFIVGLAVVIGLAAAPARPASATPAPTAEGLATGVAALPVTPVGREAFLPAAPTPSAAEPSVPDAPLLAAPAAPEIVEGRAPRAEAPTARGALAEVGPCDMAAPGAEVAATFTLFELTAARGALAVVSPLPVIALSTVPEALADALARTAPEARSALDGRGGSERPNNTSESVNSTDPSVGMSAESGEACCSSPPPRAGGAFEAEAALSNAPYASKSSSEFIVPLEEGG